ncbi:hypothetical protein EV361DRAFT_929529 [Lentinula raphanica]|nr:hypothetical protein EV361DRAFT_929529 [Lentinula raphanica]
MSTSDTGTLVDTHYLQYDVTWASIALLYYDWALTFPDEVEYIWKAGITFPTILYVFCRYALLANVMYLLEISNLLGSSFSITCDNWAKFVAALSVFGRAAIIVTLIGRTYAVCSQSRWVLAYLLALGIVCVVADALHVPAETCVDVKNPAMSTGLRSFFMIAFETSVVILTTIRTIQALQVGGPWKSQKHRLIYLIFEEGILYFCIVTVLTIATVILDLRAPTGFLQRLLDGLTLPLSGAFTARFILHLRAWRRKHAGVYFISTVQDPDVGSEHPTPAFSPPSSGNRTVIDLQSSLSQSVPALGDFGEDPVAREIRQSESGIAVQVDFLVEHHEAI